MGASENAPLPQLRTVRELPTTLLDHVTVCTEEGLYSQALSLLTSSLVAGTGTTRPANVPPSRFIALAATLAVHPSMTTRTSSKDKHTAADDALGYLIHLERLVGAKNARFPHAFHFDQTADFRAMRAQSRRSLNSEDLEVENLRCVFAGQESLWSRSVDFWHLLGWALNCSVLYRHRWMRWKHLLNVMLDALESDFSQAIAQHQLTDGAEDAFQETLLVQYLSAVGAGRSDKRRIMRAILADGGAKSMAEFGQIWERETAAPKADTSTRKKRLKLDLERGVYGDYDIDSDDDLDTAAHTSIVDTLMSVPDSADILQDSEATKIRQRYIALLVSLCDAYPSAFLSIEELFDLYSEFLRTLPVRQFQELVMGLGTYLGHDLQSSLYQMLLRPSIDAHAPVYSKNELTQTDFETYFAPYAANSSSLSDNVKVSLLIEGSLRLLWTAGMLTTSEDLEKYVRHGVTARSKVDACARADEGRREADDDKYEEDGPPARGCPP